MYFLFFYGNRFYYAGQFDQEVYVKSLEQENTELKTRIQSLMNESVLYKNEREGKTYFHHMSTVVGNEVLLEYRISFFKPFWLEKRILMRRRI